jgi:uncharacterized protein (TIGR00375 family)
MKFISDLHIHSRFSRATSNQLNIKNLEKYAKLKGVDLLGTGDFLHPEWLAEIKKELKEDGVYRTESGFPFILSNEISLMYKQDNRGRRVHLVLLAPSFEVVDQMVDYFKRFGRVDYDGRPIFGKTAIEITEGLKSISKDIEIIPAHIWTPWFGLLGSKSGFDSVEEAFKDQSKHIFALETGLSSDPEMNWRLSFLDKFTLVSFSDLHSFWPWRLGREATILDLKDLTYKNLIKSIREREGYAGTVEVDPAYGKYHFDGHRACGIRLSPAQTRKVNGICPKCGKPLTVGVEYRVEQLADRPQGFKPKNAVPYHVLLPLSELISAVTGTKQLYSQKIWQIYNKLIAEFGSEYAVLLEAPKDKLKKVVDEKLAKLILQNRKDRIKVLPGYDGVYGEAILDGKRKIETVELESSPQKNLLDY